MHLNFTIKELRFFRRALSIMLLAMLGAIFWGIVERNGLIMITTTLLGTIVLMTITALKRVESRHYTRHNAELSALKNEVFRLCCQLRLDRMDNTLVYAYIKSGVKIEIHGIAGVRYWIMLTSVGAGLHEEVVITVANTDMYAIAERRIFDNDVPAIEKVTADELRYLLENWQGVFAEDEI